MVVGIITYIVYLIMFAYTFVSWCTIKRLWINPISIEKMCYSLELSFSLTMSNQRWQKLSVNSTTALFKMYFIITFINNGFKKMFVYVSYFAHLKFRSTPSLVPVLLKLSLLFFLVQIRQKFKIWCTIDCYFLILLLIFVMPIPGSQMKNIYINENPESRDF